MSTNGAVIELEHVHVSYGPVVALDDVTLSVGKGEFLGVIGPNGAGKSTLLQVILGMVKPTKGTVRVFGKPVRELGSDIRRIGYVPQLSTLDTRFPIRVADVVVMGRYNQIGLGRLPSAQDRQAATEALELVHMGDLRNRQIGQLSGGQRQRVLVARALSAKPELLLLDEPMTGIDAKVRTGLYELINDLHKSMGLTVILVSHDVNVVSKVVDKVACMNRRLVAHGLPRQAVGADMLESTYGSGAMFFVHGEVPHLVVEQACILADEMSEESSSPHPHEENVH
jgi:zinc transport system ATP-binding protein